MWSHTHALHDLFTHIHSHTHRIHVIQNRIFAWLTIIIYELVNLVFYWDPGNIERRKGGGGQMLLRSVMARKENFPTLKFYPCVWES